MEQGFAFKSFRNESITMELLCVITSDLTFRESLNHFHSRNLLDWKRCEEENDDVYDDVLSCFPA